MQFRYFEGSFLFSCIRQHWAVNYSVSGLEVEPDVWSLNSRIINGVQWMTQVEINLHNNFTALQLPSILTWFALKMKIKIHVKNWRCVLTGLCVSVQCYGTRHIAMLLHVKVSCQQASCWSLCIFTDITASNYISGYVYCMVDCFFLSKNYILPLSSSRFKRQYMITNTLLVRSDGISSRLVQSLKVHLLNVL